MSTLRRFVLDELKLAGVTRREYVEHFFGAGATWGGDVCGCSDDRCSGGFHHEGVDDCQCFPVCLDEVLAARTPSAETSPVETPAGDEGTADRAAVADAEIRGSADATGESVGSGSPVPDDVNSDIVAALREIADLIEAHPGLPLLDSSYRNGLDVHSCFGTTEQPASAASAIEATAAAMGVGVRTYANGGYRYWTATRKFGPVEFKAFSASPEPTPGQCSCGAECTHGGAR